MTTDSILTWCQTHTIAAAGLVVAGVTATLVLVAWLVHRLRRHDLADVITVMVALSATGYAGTGTWKYLTDAMHYGVDLKVFLVAVLEGAQIAEALRARKNIRELGSAGVDGAGLWVLTGISAALSTSVAGNVREALGRLAIPLVGAWLWERALAPQRRAAKARKAAGPVRWRVTPERIFVWLRLADAVDTDVARVEAARQIVRFLRRSDRERNGRRNPLSAAARVDRARMGLFSDALRGGDPTALHAQLTQSAYADALARLEVAPQGASRPASDVHPKTAVPAGEARNSGRTRRASSKRSGSGSKRASKRLDEAQLADEAARLNAESWAADNRPVSLRTLQRELHIGQPKATALLEALAAAPEVASDHAPQDAVGMRVPLVLGDPIRRPLSAVNGTTRQ